LYYADGAFRLRFFQEQLLYGLWYKSQRAYIHQGYAAVLFPDVAEGIV
jgi:hypothetical protein